MSLLTIASETLVNIANAIRAKTGNTATMTPAQMVTEITSIIGKVVRSWEQCPVAVRQYLDTVTYTNDYASTRITEFAPNPPVIANTKPIALTLDGVDYYNNIPKIKTPFSSANMAGTVEPLYFLRWINSKTTNMRDLGGWACDGGVVKYGLLYRSGELNAQDENLFINELRINTECDLTADGTPAFPGKMRYIGHTSYAMYSLANADAWRVNLRGIFDAVQYGDAVVFHCSMGADRTGTLACILEGLLGVSQSDIDKDYELTSFYSLRARNGNYQGGTTDWAHLISEIYAYRGDNFKQKIINFVYDLGFTQAEINNYRQAMIDGNPAIVVPDEPAQNLFDFSTATLNQRFSSSGSYNALDGNFCTDFIPVTGLDKSEPWRIHIKDTASAARFQNGAQQESIAYFKADKSIMNTSYGRLGILTTSGSSTLCKHDDSNGGVYIDINKTGDENQIPASYFDLSQVAYIRICMAYSSGKAIENNNVLATVEITA